MSVLLSRKAPNKTDKTDKTEGRGPTDLTDIDRASSILLQNEDYIVLSKPADVRLDGQFAVTVEKLLLSWELPSVRSTANIKWVHQLDYATSGCLCVALHRKAAAAASQAFAQREVRKQYLALVYGHLDLERWTLEDNEPPVCDYGITNATSNKHAARATSTWQEQARDESFEIFYCALLEELSKKSSGVVSDSSLDELTELAKLPREKYQKSYKLRKALRKALRAKGLCLDVPEASENARPTKTARSEAPETTNAPQSFQIASSAAHLVRRYRDSESSSFLRITIPIAEVEGDFRMEVGHEGRPGKPSETDLRVLELGYYKGDPVTKVLLKPLTGRRHQLRVHCLALGCPIVGDFTYCETDSLSQARAARADRMMLHAFSLEIPTPSCKRKSSDTNQQPPSTLVSVQTPDPFEACLDEVS